MNPREWIGDDSLEGKHVRLEPLGSEHLPDLFACSAPDTFRYFAAWPKEWTFECFSQLVQKYIDEQLRRHYAVIDLSTGKPVGSTSFLDIRPEHKGLEIGFTWYAPSMRGTSVNPECKLLLLTHAFERLGCMRVQLRCDARNLRSQRAIAKLGAAREGTLRKMMLLADGHERDIVVFSIIPEEWPGVKAGLESRLRDPSARE